MKRFNTIGVLTSGGDAPGMNCAIRAITRRALANGLKVKGIIGGYSGLIKGEIIDLDARAVSNIENLGGTVLLTDRCDEFKTEEGMAKAIATCKKNNIDGIIAIGGGSSMDTAKAIGIIIENPEFADVRSLEGVAPTKNPCVPIIAVPTTAGTAAEVTINYVITDAEKNRKMVCVDVHDIPVVAVVDPDMMATMPKSLTAATGMDRRTFGCLSISLG